MRRCLIRAIIPACISLYQLPLGVLANYYGFIYFKNEADLQHDSGPYSPARLTRCVDLGPFLDMTSSVPQ